MAEWDGFAVEGRLGSGTTGTVWLARQLSLSRQVAIKELAPELAGIPAVRDRLRHEAQMLARLDHPNCVAVYSYLESGSAAAIVMEYVEGVSLRTLIDQSPLSVEQALSVLEGALGGLAHAHEHGVVHGDLKPENILLATSGVSKLVDFGLAAVVGTQRAPGTGSPTYSSPEAAAGEPLGIASDLYSAGLVLYELLAGKVPAGGGAVLGGGVALDAVPAPVASLVRRALDPDPAARPESAAVFLDDLRAAAQTGCGSDWRRRAVIAPLVVAAASGAASALGATKAGAATPSAANPDTGATARGSGKATRLLRTHPWAATAAGAVVVAAAVLGVAAAQGGGGTPSSNVAKATTATAAPSTTTTLQAPPTTVTSQSRATSASGTGLDGTYTISLPPGDDSCGAPSLSGETLTVSGTSATITPVGGGTPLTGTAGTTGTTLTVHVTNGITDAPGAIVVDLTGDIQPGGDLSGQSQNSGIFPGGAQGFGCNFAFTAARSSGPNSSAGGPPAATAGPNTPSGSSAGSQQAATVAAAQWYAQGTNSCAAHPPGQAPPVSPTTIPASSIPVTWSQFTPGQSGSGQAGDGSTGGPGQFTAAYQNGTWSFNALFNFC